MIDQNSIKESFTQYLSKFLSENAFKILSKGWQVFRNSISKKPEGIYEVLGYETVLELKDRRGKRATVQKREKVRYLQDNVIAYQDQAWGDGKILENYRCAPGVPVDRYRSGYKTLVLISLRSIKNRGDVDEFKIDWQINDGFLKSTGFWATEINHPTNVIKIRVIFPKSRSPLKASVLEKNRQRVISIDKDAIQNLPDGRWELSWERTKPSLYEQYILNWVW